MPHRSSNREMWNSISSVVLLLCYKHFFIFRLTSQWYSFWPLSLNEWWCKFIHQWEIIRNASWSNLSMNADVRKEQNHLSLISFELESVVTLELEKLKQSLGTKAEEKKVWCCIQKQILFTVQKWGNKDFEVLKLALQVEVGLKLLGK